MQSLGDCFHVKMVAPIHVKSLKYPWPSLSIAKSDVDWGRRGGRGTARQCVSFHIRLCRKNPNVNISTLQDDLYLEQSLENFWLVELIFDSLWQI